MFQNLRIPTRFEQYPRTPILDERREPPRCESRVLAAKPDVAKQGTVETHVSESTRRGLPLTVLRYRGLRPRFRDTRAP